MPCQEEDQGIIACKDRSSKGPAFAEFVLVWIIARIFGTSLGASESARLMHGTVLWGQFHSFCISEEDV